MPEKPNEHGSKRIEDTFPYCLLPYRNAPSCGGANLQELKSVYKNTSLLHTPDIVPIRQTGVSKSISLSSASPFPHSPTRIPLSSRRHPPLQVTSALSQSRVYRVCMSTTSNSGSPDKKIEKMGSSHAASSSTRKGSSSKSKRSSSDKSNRGSYNNGAGGFSAGASSSHELPKSVRNAPPELRTAIRRRQNNESAKRSRERKREEQAEMQRKFHKNSKRIEELEKQVDDLTNYLSKKKSSKKKDNSDRHYQDPGSPSGNPNFYGDPF